MADIMLVAKVMKCFPPKWKVTPELINKLNDALTLIELYNQK